MTKPKNDYIMDELYTFDVYKAYLIEPTTGLELYTDTVVDTNLQFSEDIKEVRAGVGNKLLTDVPSSKSISLDLTDVRTRLDWIAARQGTEILKGKAEAWHLPKVYTAVSNSTSVEITLDETPKVTGDVRFMKKGENGVYTEVTGGTITGKTVKFSTGVNAGDLILVTGYKYETTADALSVDFDTEKFAKAFKVILEGLVFDGNRTPRFKKQYIFYKGVLDGNFEDATKSERDASQSKTTIKMQLENGRTSLGQLLFIPLS